MADYVIPMYACRDRFDRPCRRVHSRTKEAEVEYLVCLGDPHRPPTCTCDGYQYNALREHRSLKAPYRCTHIKKVEAESCAYHSLTHGAPMSKGRGTARRLVCPLCGGPVALVLES